MSDEGDVGRLSTTGRMPKWVPGVVLAGASAALAWLGHGLLPAVPFLTLAIGLGIATAQVPPIARLYDGWFQAGISVASRRLMRIGIVLLGLQLNVGIVLGLGVLPVLGIVVIVIITFWATWGLGRLFRMPDKESVLLAAGFSVCGASAIGAMAGAIGAKDRDAATPVALVTLCGTAAVFLLPLLWGPLGLDSEAFGRWVGASVHDVGQVVATAQVAGTIALGVAIAVKLVRVLMLAPMVAIAAGWYRRKEHRDATQKRTPVVPLFIAGFLAAILIRTFVPLPEVILDTAGVAHTALLGVALFALGTAVRFSALVRTGWRALCVALTSWLIIAGLALALVTLAA